MSIGQGVQLGTFIKRRLAVREPSWTAVSVFSGAGLSDLGYYLAGFQFVVQVELEEKRAKLGERNFPDSAWIVGDVAKKQRLIADTYYSKADKPLDLLVATPPCQGMSSSNPGRGKRQTDKAKRNEAKNRLILEVIPLAKLLRPRIIVAENVRPVLTLKVSHRKQDAQIVELLKRQLPDYTVFSGVVNVADYGVPQVRKRAVVVAIRDGEPSLEQLAERSLFPWPRPTHADEPGDGVPGWVSVKEWLEQMAYEPLDAKSAETARGKHPLHFVPHYDDDRYLMVASIPPDSGRSAYQNETCPACSFRPVPADLVRCGRCRQLMRNRPYVKVGGEYRLIKGFGSSYRRMHPARPAATITTNSSHIGSDFKIHPWENRVLSILECMHLQTVPNSYDWTPATDNGLFYLVRNVIGEAFPPYFTYLHGKVLAKLLTGEQPDEVSFAAAPIRQIRPRTDGESRRSG